MKRLIVPTNSFPENLRNNRVAQVLEKELPHWPEDCRREYHAITRGLIFFFKRFDIFNLAFPCCNIKNWKGAVIQELFRRVDPKGRSIGQFLRPVIDNGMSNVLRDHHSHHHHLCKVGRNGWPSSHCREELLIDLEADVFIGLSEAEQREKHIADLRAFPAAEVRTLSRYIVPVRNFILFNSPRLRVNRIASPPAKN